MECCDITSNSSIKTLNYWNLSFFFERDNSVYNLRFEFVYETIISQ